MNPALPTHPTMRHPRTGQPLRAVGFRRDGRAIWPIMGGDGTDPAPSDPAPTPDPTPDPTPTPADPAPGEDHAAQLADAQSALAALRTEQEQTNATLTALRTALGLEASPEADPAAQVSELTGQVQSLTSDLAAASASLVVFELAAANGANPNALLDSRSFAATLGNLDASAADYRDRVAAAIKAAAEANPAYRAGSSKGGAELDGEQREPAKRNRPDLAGAIGAAMKS